MWFTLTRTEISHQVIRVVVLVLSLSVHEWAHAYAAFKLGDDTAERQGRLTLNPLAHIDPIGSILLPLLSVPFGWAKPVPVNPARFTRRVTMKTGMAITAFAGPLSNFVLAVLAALVLGLTLRLHVPTDEAFTPRTSPVLHTLTLAVTMNVGLGLFNLLPIPPLDGSRLLERFLVYRYPSVWDAIERYGKYGLILAFVAGRFVLDVPIQFMTNKLWLLASLIAGS
jgi:Zn-dependent protease